MYSLFAFRNAMVDVGSLPSRFRNLLTIGKTNSGLLICGGGRWGEGGRHHGAGAVTRIPCRFFFLVCRVVVCAAVLVVCLCLCVTCFSLT